MKKLFLIPVVIAIFIIPVFLFGKAPVPAGDLKITKTGDKKSAATYNHTKHAKIKGADDCDGCHEAVKTMAKAHKMCIICHKKEKAGPTKCNDCHK